MTGRRRFLVASTRAATAAATLAAPAAWARPIVGGRTLKFVFSRPRSNPRTQWLIRIYSDICATLGLRFEYLDVPPRRATALVLAGEADGELGRTHGFKLFFPELVRVEEATNPVSLCVYGANPAITYTTMEAVRKQGLRCDCRRGIKELEAYLYERLDAAQISLSDEMWQGLKKLQLGRVDLFFEVREAVQDYFYLRHCRWDLDETPPIRELGLIRATTGHCYLNKSHADLAPQFAAALRELKRSGKVAQYLDECLAAYKRDCR